MKPSLSYRNDKDRCYGATGMAIGIVVFDGEEYVTRISVDTPADRMVEYEESFYFSRNPRLSAKDQWHQMLQSFNLSVVAMLSNLLCRTLVLDNMPVSFEVKQLLRDTVAEEGRESCSLDPDEVDRIFNKNYDYLMRIFNHRGVQSVAHDFAATLAQERTLTRLEILEHLKALSMI